jgi:arylsulfatase A
VREFAFNQEYKLYRSGEFYNLAEDPQEKQPREVNSLEGEAAAAAKVLQGALDQYADARPAHLRESSAKPPAKQKAKAKKAKAKAN